MRRPFFGLVLILTACDAPGHGPKAESGYRRAAPIIAALDSFARDSGFYPPTLEALVPGYLTGDALEIPEQDQEAYPFEYSRADSSYRLTFRYAGPGMNQCDFQPSTRWTCSGLF